MVKRISAVLMLLSGKTFSNGSAANITGTMSPPTRALGCLPDINILPPPDFLHGCRDSCDSLDFLSIHLPPDVINAMLCSVPDPGPD